MGEGYISVKYDDDNATIEVPRFVPVGLQRERFPTVIRPSTKAATTVAFDAWKTNMNKLSKLQRINEIYNLRDELNKLYSKQKTDKDKEAYENAVRVLESMADDVKDGDDDMIMCTQY